jgi:hypothetical protein
MLGVGGDRSQGLDRCLEQKAIDDRLVLEGDLADGRGHGEDDVEILGRQQLSLPLGEPLGAGEALAFGTMPVAAGIVGLPGEAAVRACLEMAAQSRRAAGLDRAHHLNLDASEVAIMSFAISSAVAAEHVRHLQGRTQHRLGQPGGAIPSFVWSSGLIVLAIVWVATWA